MAASMSMEHFSGSSDALEAAKAEEDCMVDERGAPGSENIEPERDRRVKRSLIFAARSSRAESP